MRTTAAWQDWALTMKVYLVIHHDIAGDFRDHAMIFHTTRSLERALELIRTCCVAKWTWWEIQVSDLDGNDWPERVGYYGLRGGKLAKPPYEKCVAIFKNENRPARTLRAEVEAKAGQLIDAVLKPRHVETPSGDGRLDHIIDIGGKWRGSYFYFFSTHAHPRRTAASRTTERKFARMEYVGGGRFNLAYMRPTGQWWQVFGRLTLPECLEAIGGDGIFHP